jgi:hypothetical protein
VTVQRRNSIRIRLAVWLALLLAIPSPGQSKKPPKYEKPVPMPAGRALDSYAIYSQLLQSGPIEWRDAPRSRWIVEDTTTAVPIADNCQAAAFTFGSTNPRLAVEAPADRMEEWSAVLADYDQHCHELLQLDQAAFRTGLPVHLLNASEKLAIRKNPLNMPANLEDAKGLHSFTEVFFNASHSLALVQQGMWCGSLCGNWMWVVLEHKDSQWKMLPWVRRFTVS